MKEEKKLKLDLLRRILLLLIVFGCLFFFGTTYFTTYSEFVSKFDEISNDTTLTGIQDNVVILDDLERDYYYYMGQNYTDSDGTLPTTVDKKLYGDNNLVQVKITYDSTDINTGDKGYVSLDDRQDTYIYYKVYPINNNNTTYTTSDDYILIELIDNPFTDRPIDKAFNGWITDYQGATISYDDDYYTRYVKVPVTLTDNVPDNIDITMHASWVEATTSYVNGSNNWANAFGSLKVDGMVQIGGQQPVYEDVTNYYISGTLKWRDNYPSGAVDSSGRTLNNRCNNLNGCTYYIHPSSGEYQEGITYYRLPTTGNNRKMQVYAVQVIDYEEVPGLAAGYHTAGYYKAVTINGSPSAGYYDENGVLQTSGTCSTNGGYTCYELIQYYDSNGNENIASEGDIYYYLVTRDTNIIVMNQSMSTTWSSSQTKPFTLTSVYNGTDYRDSVTWNIASSNWWESLSDISVDCYNDTVIENIKISSGSTFSSDNTLPSGSTGTAGILYARWNNVKLGRGITRNNNYINFNAVLGGSNSSTGSSSNVTKYRLIVESGFYNNVGLANGNTSSTTATYIEGQGIFGNDYDRATNYNDNLIIGYNVAGSFGGVYYSSSTTSIGFDFVVKSGKFGDNKYDVYAGIYIGGRGNSNGKHYTARRVKYEGGYTYNLIGGPITGQNRASYNDSYMYIMGGNIDMVYGGAGQSATYGNRIIQMTGGTINYSIFGGSNGESAGNGEGTINGSSYIYRWKCCCWR